MSMCLGLPAFVFLVPAPETAPQLYSQGSGRGAAYLEISWDGLWFLKGYVDRLAARKKDGEGKCLWL